MRSVTEGQEKFAGLVGSVGIAECVARGILRWFGYVERKSADNWISMCREMSVVGARRRGRGRKTWMECVEKDMHRLQLRSEDALDRGVWRNGILGNVQPVLARKHGR